MPHYQAQHFLENVLCFPLKRQLRVEDTQLRGTPYFQKVMGNSPEFARATDSHGFADLKKSVHDHVVLSQAFHEIGDSRRFGAGTPAELQFTIERVWQVAPSSQRIVEDISAFPRVLEVIIANEGTAVDDLATRSGKRGAATPVKNFQRKEKTELGEYHEDLGPAVAKLLSTTCCSVDMTKLFRSPVRMQQSNQLERACLACGSHIVVDLQPVVDESDIAVTVDCPECQAEQQIWCGELPSTSHRKLPSCFFDFSRATPTPATTVGAAKFLTSVRRTGPEPDEVSD